ncbi:hypothetical protein PFICI_13902 [Pestalotiopsis fici W106-1]|uniref:Uncharacterized protein n=1 Tax=Pestalotiopsis fici (strain W106-1 / CGMCC3.15140) TaxID=1229662 RepID=W3WMI9_PESFW|nr:uncharacterized protein PFICI_13902 [Pestalotiopsis fici W106-1]ETS74036.1 hypothetical protein PFICI_13902 [Pestalotiopsis fici W106-1]
MNAKLNTSGLCWHHGVEGNSRRQGFPSWSWVGWHGAVSWTLPYGSAEDGEKTVFQLEVAGFRAGVGEERMDLGEARRAKSGPLVLNLASVAIPASAFALKDVEGTDGRHDNDTISMYGCPMPWGADESVTNATETRWTLQRSYLSHANGTRKASRQTLRQGLQEGTFKLMLVHVYRDSDERLRFQAWILQKTSDHKGESCYERVGGVNHIVLANGPATEEERDTFQGSLYKLVKGDEFEMFDIC